MKKSLGFRNSKFCKSELQLDDFLAAEFLKNDQNTQNLKWNQNSALDAGPRNWNQKSIPNQEQGDQQAGDLPAGGRVKIP